MTTYFDYNPGIVLAHLYPDSEGRDWIVTQNSKTQKWEFQWWNESLGPRPDEATIDNHRAEAFSIREEKNAIITGGTLGKQPTNAAVNAAYQARNLNII